jgi:hypothetical protein
VGGGAAAEWSLTAHYTCYSSADRQDDVNTQTPAVRHATASCSGAAALASNLLCSGPVSRDLLFGMIA